MAVLKYKKDGVWHNVSVSSDSANAGVIIQNEEPTDAPVGTIWINTSEESVIQTGVTHAEMETYVNDAILAAIDNIVVAEEGAY